jgi:hypothetical protein
MNKAERTATVIKFANNGSDILLKKMDTAKNIIRGTPNDIVL